MIAATAIKTSFLDETFGSARLRGAEVKPPQVKNEPLAFCE
jgi:hypothetical protein